MTNANDQAKRVMAGSYDYRLVALSVLIAVLASYAPLDLAGRQLERATLDQRSNPEGNSILTLLQAKPRPPQKSRPTGNSRHARNHAW
jgi:hypothetical protein